MSKLHCSAGSAAILSKNTLSFEMVSFVMLRTSSGECVQDGGGTGGVSEAIWEGIDEMGENKFARVD